MSVLACCLPLNSSPNRPVRRMGRHAPPTPPTDHTAVQHTYAVGAASIGRSTSTVEPYVLLAKQLENKAPLVAFGVWRYAATIAMDLASTGGDKDAPVNYAEDLFSEAQRMKPPVSVSAEAVDEAMVVYCRETFASAVVEDDAGNHSLALVKKFYRATLLYSAIAGGEDQTGKLEAVDVQRRTFAKQKALYIKKCLSSNTTPVRGPLSAQDLAAVGLKPSGVSSHNNRDKLLHQQQVFDNSPSVSNRRCTVIGDYSGRSPGGLGHLGAIPALGKDAGQQRRPVDSLSKNYSSGNIHGMGGAGGAGGGRGAHGHSAAVAGSAGRKQGAGSPPGAASDFRHLGPIVDEDCCNSAGCNRKHDYDFCDDTTGKKDPTGKGSGKCPGGATGTLRSYSDNNGSDSGDVQPVPQDKPGHREVRTLEKFDELVERQRAIEHGKRMTEFAVSAMNFGSVNEAIKHLRSALDKLEPFKDNPT